MQKAERARVCVRAVPVRPPRSHASRSSCLSSSLPVGAAAILRVKPTHPPALSMRELRGLLRGLSATALG